MKFVCKHCGWIFDEKKGLLEADIEPDTPWDEIPDDFEGPLCWAGKEKFAAVSE